ncbi:T9SS type A sorting domain-containing protein [Spirosoma radiotolerans]|uniref:Secretion system C-terminal sorting domain-containing protein n=1 Tax=Spirosoma radiotolerans TaxID=1379870 RepID=A0A0E3ZX50_9BACT|nr:T9SS type A sorting domain-containing protein [Spirosoma radiotolerans]AKD56168.1 hypothetical protein SD10_15955 [Spirosoma radiotolerans]
MKALINPLVIAFTLTLATFSVSLANTNPGGRPATVASYKTGMYTTAEGKLQIAVDKEATGAVDIQLVNADGKVLFAQRVAKKETIARLRLTLSDLPDGAYQVRVSNGVDTTTHSVTLSTNQPSAPSRLVAIN